MFSSTSFGREVTCSLLINLLNLLLNLPEGAKIIEIELLNPYNLQDALDDKLSILDIKARDQMGRLFNIEMQILAFQYYIKRILYYWASLYQDQLHQGQDYGQLRQTISISFLNHKVFADVEGYHHTFHLREDKQGFVMTTDIEFHRCGVVEVQ